jgi:hypothetical protein
LAIVAEEDEAKAAAAKDITRTLEGFCSIPLDGPIAAVVLQYKAHQNNTKSQVKKETVSEYLDGSAFFNGIR